MKMRDESAPDRARTVPKIGPSDSSDTYSDRPDEAPTDTDSGYTGERVTPGLDPRAGTEPGSNIDRVVGPEEAGLGDGLDEAEEARLRKPKP